MERIPSRTPHRSWAAIRRRKARHLRASCVPQQYTYTKINSRWRKATLFDAALFYQDDWKVNPALHIQLWRALGDAELDQRQRRLGAAIELCLRAGQRHRYAAQDGSARRIRMVLSAFHGRQWIRRQCALRDQHDPRERSERATIHSDFGYHLQSIRNDADLASSAGTRQERMLRRFTPSRRIFMRPTTWRRRSAWTGRSRS